ncbi:MAG: hypothetical protein EXR75_08975 [Myxococcales bacterium]|nr:hypothetical protein [Myxococcales bacterium]
MALKSQQFVYGANRSAMQRPHRTARPRRLASLVSHAALALVVTAATAARAKDDAETTAALPTAEPSQAKPSQIAPPKAESSHAEPPSSAPPPTEGAHTGGFAFGSYGRVHAATDAEGRPTRDTDIVAHGSRLDLDTYVELELRRDDRWLAVDADTSVVATLALGAPVFHHDGRFDASIAVRNLYFEERDLGTPGLAVWVGSRMLRGDNIYLLDWWPLDERLAVGGGVRYEAPTRTIAEVQLGFGRPDNPFYHQLSERPAAAGQFGATTVALLDRQRLIGSARIEQRIRIGAAAAGLKLVGYGEGHSLPAGERESALGARATLPPETGFVVGAQLGAMTGERDGFIHVFARYAGGIAAYGPFSAPDGLGVDRSTAGAHELVVATSANYELGPAAISLGAYVRSFRNASAALDFADVDEVIAIVRPQLWLSRFAGIALEGNYQLAMRGVVVDVDPEAEDAGVVGSSAPAPLVGRVAKVSVMPFLSPAGRGSFKRPLLWLAYTATFRDEGARMLYPVDDPFRTRSIDHYFGLAAEWWFGQTYGGE